MKEGRNGQIDRLIDWAEGSEAKNGHEKVDEIDFCSSDLADDRVGLPSGVIADESILPEGRRLIDCGCAADDECRECAPIKTAKRNGGKH